MLPLLPWLQPLNEEAAADDWLESEATVTEEEGLLVDEVSSDGNKWSNRNVGMSCRRAGSKEV